MKFLAITMYLLFSISLNSGYHVSITNPLGEKDNASIENYLYDILGKSEHLVQPLQQVEKYIKKLGFFKEILCRSVDQTVACDLKRFRVLETINISGVPSVLLIAPLKKSLGLKPGKLLKRHKNNFEIIDSLTKRVGTFLNKLGFYGPEIIVKITELPDNPRVAINIEVLGGHFLHVDKVSIVGDLPMREAKMVKPFKRMCFSFKNLFKAISMGSFACFSDEDEEGALADLVQMLNKKGYYQAEIQTSHFPVECSRSFRKPNYQCLEIHVHLNAGPKVKVEFDFKEGSQYGNLNDFENILMTLSGASTLSRSYGQSMGTGKYPYDEVININTLRDALSFEESKIINTLEINRSAERMAAVLSQFGYFSAEVSGKVTFQNESAIVVKFTIAPGEPGRLTKIDFVGNAKIDSNTLQKDLSLTSHVKSVFDDGFVTQEEIDSDILKVKGFYKSHGYYSTEVSSRLYFDKRHEYGLVFIIDEGEQSVTKQIMISGGKPEINQEVLAGFGNCQNGSNKNCAGAVFHKDLVESDKQKLMFAYKKNGYPFLKIDTKTSTKTNHTNSSLDNVVQYTLSNAERPFEINSVLLEDINSNSTSILSREMGLAFRPEKPYDFRLRKIEQGAANIRLSGIFSSVNYRAIYNPDLYRSVLVLNVVEKPTLTLDTALSFSTDNLFGVFVEFSELNLLGSFLQLDIASELGLFWGRQSDFSLTLTWPRIWGWPLYFQVYLPYLLYEDNPQFSKPERHIKLTAYANLIYKFNLLLNFSLGYKFRMDKWQRDPGPVSFFDNPGRSIETLDGFLLAAKAESSFRGMIIPGIKYIDLDSVFNPTKGVSFQGQLNLSQKIFGAKIPYTIIFLNLTTYYTFWDVLTVAARIQANRSFIGNPKEQWWVLKYQSDVETLGGDSTVRGYREDSIGVYGELWDDSGSRNEGSQGVHVGNMNLVLNLEFRFPLVKNLPLGQLDGTIFTDFGYVNICEDFLSNCAVPLEESQKQNLGWSIGIGLRYLLPVGPISFDYAISPIHEGSGLFGQQNRFHLVFGYPF